MGNIKVSAVIIFHRERYYSIPAIKSFLRMVEYGRNKGLSVETIAVLDNSDTFTDEVVTRYETKIDKLMRVTNGDLGVNRNQALRESKGEFVTFLDGDDLWGEQWIYNAFQHSTNKAENALKILHPELLFYFNEADFDAYSPGHAPSAYAKSFWFRHVGSGEPYFPRKSILLDNIWSANSFSHRSLYEKYPYKAVDRIHGFGVEDWSWNIETLFHGIAHETVQDTVHAIRVKESDSLGKSNFLGGLLPSLPEGLVATKF